MWDILLLFDTKYFSTLINISKKSPALCQFGMVGSVKGLAMSEECQLSPAWIFRKGKNITTRGFLSPLLAPSHFYTCGANTIIPLKSWLQLNLDFLVPLLHLPFFHVLFSRSFIQKYLNIRSEGNNKETFDQCFQMLLQNFTANFDSISAHKNS